MKLDERRLVDQALVAEEPCLGAVFCSYTFEPAYFEDHVLRSLLRLRGDPDEDGSHYHEEARRALQETPVACIVDASVRRAGRRLPYDVHLVRRRTFHPKVILVLYESDARLAIGSGNVTKPGLEQNTELFFVRRLRYREPADAALLRDVDTFLAECARLSGTTGTQLSLIRDALASRLVSTPRLDPEERIDVKFVSSFGGRLLDRLQEVLHHDAKIVRVGVLAPFFEQDDAAAASTDEGVHAVLAEVLNLRPSTNAILDVGVPWDDAPLASPATTSSPSLDDHVGDLWAWRKRETIDGAALEHMEYFVVNAPGAKRIEATNAAGETCRFDRETLEAEIEQGRIWPVSRPVVHAPKMILRRIAAEHAVRLWLHPAAESLPQVAHVEGHSMQRRFS